MSTYQPYLTTLRRIPADIVLALGARDIEPQSVQRCLCGWAVREAIARAADLPAETIHSHTIITACVKQFGGGREEWSDIFYGVLRPNTMPAIERAFVERVLESVEAAS
jgi:hypothetical protein